MLFPFVVTVPNSSLLPLLFFFGFLESCWEDRRNRR